MAQHSARGKFDVEMEPIGKEDRAEGNVLGSALVKKRFHGDLEGAGRGRMTAARTAVEGSAGYVMIEQVRGTLAGRSGTFLLQHSGILDRGVAAARIEIVPDSGTGELVGLKGRLVIRAANGPHEYELLYSLPHARSAQAGPPRRVRPRARP
jgi:hypothetical protein